jgi:putative peptide maturation system protein
MPTAFAAEVITDSAGLLARLSALRPPPERALEEVGPLRLRHPDVAFDLLWTEDGPDGFLIYQILLRASDGTTLSLGQAPARAIPWPLRGTQRWHDSYLLAVNGRSLRIGEAFGYLDFFWGDRRAQQQLVDACLVREALEAAPVSLGDGEVQAALDELRRARGLFTAEDTRRWLEQYRLTHDALERQARTLASYQRLRQREVGDLVPAHFETHRRDFDGAVLSRLRVASEKQGRELVAAIDRGEDDLTAAARRLAAGATFFATVRRHQLPADLAEAVLDRGQRLLLRRERPGVHEVVQVTELVPARLDEATRAAVLDQLFERWLEERRAAAQVVWFWGRSEGLPSPLQLARARAEAEARG